MQLESAELESLLAWVAQSGGSVSPDQLVCQAAALLLERDVAARAYAPGARYAVGERVRFEGHVAEVVAVHQRGSPVQGSFAVLELRLPDGSVTRVVAEVRRAPRVGVSSENSGEKLAAFLNMHAPALRESLGKDPTLAALIAVPVDVVAFSVPLAREVVAPVRSSTLFHARALDSFTGASRLTGSLAMAVGPEDAGALHDAELRTRYETLRIAFGRVTGGGLAAAETWARFVAPAIVALGWAYAPLPDGGGFALYPDTGGRDRALSGLQSGIPLLNSALALVMVEGWGCPLGRQPDRDDPTAEAMTCSAAMRLTGRLLSAGTAWGILTNGREWRLYSSAWGDPDVGSTLGTFHAVDLLDIFGSSGVAEGPSDAQRQRFQSWTAVFGPGASVPDAYGRSMTDGLKRESSAYAREVVRDLRRRLLESILPEIAGGFIIYRSVELGANVETDETLEEIARAGLGLVYRLLFVLHAEQHGVLPMGNPDYRGESLSTLVRWARDCMEDGPLPSAATHATPRYDGLLTLFHHLDQGHPLLGLAEASGGLFSAANPETGFLERHRLSDRVVARTLSALGTVDGQPVDYSVVSIRALSAVAEGLLENLLWVVEPTAGQVVLISNRGEPQTPSSVPVPDFVGVSVIEEAITAVIKARQTRFTSAMDKIAILRRASSGDLGERAALAAAEQAAYDALLGIRVLDPAMGTGTFLVAVVDTLVDGIAEVLTAYHRTHPWVPWSWNPVTRRLVETREAILVAAEAQGVVVQPDGLEDDVMLSRLVVERVIYGVDLNPTAVALARASIAMRAFAAGAPFIDVTRHIRRGDSLLGTRLAGVRDEMLASGLAAGLSASNAALEGDEEVPDPAPFEALLDLWCSEDLGNDGARALLGRLGDKALSALRGEIPLGSADAVVVRRARELADAFGFVHWDVVFPEVFLRRNGDDEGQRGFDVIIGSPPAVSPTSVTDRGEGGAFLSQARQLVRRPGGRVAFVVTPSRKG